MGEGLEGMAYGVYGMYGVYRVWDTGCGSGVAEYGVWDAGYGIRAVGQALQSMGYGMRGMGCGLSGAGCGSGDARFGRREPRGWDAPPRPTSPISPHCRKWACPPHSHAPLSGTTPPVIPAHRKWAYLEGGASAAGREEERGAVRWRRRRCWSSSARSPCCPPTARRPSASCTPSVRPGAPSHPAGGSRPLPAASVPRHGRLLTHGAARPAGRGAAGGPEPTAVGGGAVFVWGAVRRCGVWGWGLPAGCGVTTCGAAAGAPSVLCEGLWGAAVGAIGSRSGLGWKGALCSSVPTPRCVQPRLPRATASLARELAPGTARGFTVMMSLQFYAWMIFLGKMIAGKGQNFCGSQKSDVTLPKMGVCKTPASCK